MRNHRIAWYVFVVVAMGLTASAALATVAGNEASADGKAPTVRVVVADGESTPPTTIPAGAVAPPRDYERSIRDASRAARTAPMPVDGQPDPLALPEVPSVGTSDEDPLTDNILWHEPAHPGASLLMTGLESDTSWAPTQAIGASQILASCAPPSGGGNCYQTDHALMTDHPNDVYAFDYWYWLGIPQTNESNGCDVLGNYDCFWFVAGLYNMDCCNAAIHIGPRRGNSGSGQAGANWYMIMSGYNNGVFVGGQSTVSLPMAKWVRVRTWRIANGTDSFPPFTPWSRWGVWALWDGNDQYLGYVEIDGTTFAISQLFVELLEENGQCQTDFERTYYNDPRWLSAGLGWGTPPDGTADYEANCANTTWEQINGDYVRDEREKNRVIPQNGNIW